MTRPPPRSPRFAGPADPGPPPDEASLRNAALAYLARYSATQVSLLRVLTRRVHRWAHAASAEPETIAAAVGAAQAVVARLVAAGAVNDALFAEGRARSLQRAGRSRRAIVAHLQSKGILDPQASLPEAPEADLSAAILYSYRRRMGPFRPPAEEDPPGTPLRVRDLARLARAGFPAQVALRVLDMPPDDAEQRLLEARRG